ncbi:lipopolysaccharide kinase InaA family protein [Desulfobacterium sp. N47]|uniref:lipopolysaccharide kinase InaA family protein n=1 Tax=Desulfobacterium sp. N47 TaxID=3115210 RepID=UPI003F4A83E5
MVSNRMLCKANNFSIYGEYANNYRDQAMMLVNGKLPSGWQWVSSSQNSTVAAKTEDVKVYYKEFLPRNIFEKIKAVLYGSRSRRACRQADILLSAGLPTPGILCWGNSNKSVFIISEAFDGIGFFDYLLNNFLSPLTWQKMKEKRLLLKSAGSLVGKLHHNGIVHGDLRQNNLLVKKDGDFFKFSFIDNERNRKWRHIPVSQIIKNIVQFSVAADNVLSRTDLMRMFIAYKSSNPGFSVENESKLLQAVYARRKPRILKSNFRFYMTHNCKPIKSRLFYGQYLINSEVAKKLSQNIDPGKWFTSESTTIKKDKNITVNLLPLSGEMIIAKRFVSNILLFRIKTLLKKERTQRLWDITHCFKVLDIPVALPLAYIIESKGLWQINSYFYSQYLSDTISLIDLSKNINDFSGWLENKKIIPRFAKILSKIHNNGFCHGDTKWVNILVNENSGDFWLIDLDGAHRSKSKSGACMLKDLARFIVDMIETGLAEKFIKDFLVVYCNARGLNKELVQKELNPHITKILERHRKKYNI